MNFVIQYRDIQQFCRICFELKPNLVSSSTQLFIGSYSCTISEILQLLFQENDHRNYPTGVCAECKELVTATFILKVKYGKTTEYLKRYIAPIDMKKNETLQTEESIEVYDRPDNCDDEEKITKSDSESVLGDTFQEKERVFGTRRGNTKPTVISKKRIHCPICPEEFESALDLRQHAHTHTTLKSYFRGKKVPKKGVFVANPYKDNSASDHSNMFYQCPICKESLTMENFCIHVETHKLQENFNCDKCDRVFRKSNHLSIHRVRAHLGEYPFKCKVCNKGFVIKKNYDCHLLTHSEQEYPHKCQHCHKRFSNPEHLHRHSFIHTQNISYNLKYKVKKCNYCKRSFKTLEELNEHRRNCTLRRGPVKDGEDGNEQKLFPCTLCSKSYYSVEGLDVHTRIKHRNNGESKNLCSVCGKSVRNIFIHMAAHANYKPFKCHLCPKAFITKTVLNQHLLVHSGEKPFVCTGCGKKFNNSYNLQVHERIHRGVKRHLCVVCGKTFLEKSYLKKHMRVHKNV